LSSLAFYAKGFEGTILGVAGPLWQGEPMETLAPIITMKNGYLFIGPLDTKSNSGVAL